VKNLLNIAGQTFIISGFVFFLLAIPLYYTYPPLYLNIGEHANGLLFLSYLGSVWTLLGLFPIMISIAIKKINVGDLVKWDNDVLVETRPDPIAIGIVVDKKDNVPVGWFNEDGERETVTKYRVFWQDIEGCGWYWEQDISSYEGGDRGE